MITKLSFFFLIIFLTLCTVNSNAQEDRISELIKIGGQLLREDSAEASLIYYEEALELTKQYHQPKKQAIILNNLGVANYKLGQYKKGIEHYKKALMVYESIGNDSLTAESQLNIALAYKEIGSYNLAIELLHEAIVIFKKNEQKRELASTYNSLGNIYARLEDFDKSISNYTLALTIRKDIEHNKGIASSLHNIGQLHLSFGNLDKAKEYLYKALKQKELHSSTSSKASTYSQLGELYLNTQNFDSSQLFLELALKLRVESNNESKISKALLNLGKLKVIQKEYSVADSLFTESKRLAYKTSSIDTQEEVLEDHLALLKELNQYETAFYLQEELLEIRNQIAGIEQKKELARLETIHQVEEKDRDLQQKNTENNELQTKNWYWSIGFVLVATMLIIIFILSVNIRKNKINIEKQNTVLTLKNQEIDLLHKELSHRTKNYFDMLKGVLILDRRSSDNQDLKKHLSNYIIRVEAMSQIQRYLLSDEKTNNQVALQLYLENIISNLESMYNANHEVKLTCSLTEVQVDYDIAMRLGLVVNEVVINAFEHGTKNVQLPSIDIELKTTKDALTIQINDNGNGFAPSRAKNNSIGNQLIELLLDKINGSVSRANNEGHQVLIKVPIN